jgi:cbb3-type cytochrome oxidase subunit 3
MDSTVSLILGIMAGTVVILNLIFLGIIYSMHRRAKAITCVCKEQEDQENGENSFHSRDYTVHNRMIFI